MGRRPHDSHDWQEAAAKTVTPPQDTTFTLYHARPGFWLGRYHYLTVYQLCVFLNGPVCNGHSTFGAALRLEAQLETSPLGLAPM